MLDKIYRPDQVERPVSAPWAARASSPPPLACPRAPLWDLAPMQVPMPRMIAGAPTLPAGGLAAETWEATPPKMRLLQL